MRSLQFALGEKENRGLKVLCLGAHCDDIEIGCGGTILKLIQQYNIEEIHWVVFCSNELREKEARKSAGLFLKGAENKIIKVHSFRDGYMPAQWSEIKDQFEELKKQADPDVIFTHTREDRHQDHRIVHNFTWNTFRNHMILEYEIPKYDGDLGQPNLFVSLDKETVSHKIEILKNSFQSQSGKQWFDDELFKGFMRVRGVESASDSGLSEAFYARKITIG